MTEPTLKLQTAPVDPAHPDAAFALYEPAVASTGPYKRGDKYLGQLLNDIDVTKIRVETAQATLAEVRKRADGWRTGAAATLGLIFASLAIKGPGEGLAKYHDGTYGDVDFGALIALTVLALVLAFAGLVFLVRAANGPTWLDGREKDALLRPYNAERYLRRAGAARWDLRLGVGLWTAATALFAIAVIVGWFL